MRQQGVGVWGAKGSSTFWETSWKADQAVWLLFSRASMIWIIGEYAERIDNADELLESFLEGFHDENTQVQLQLLTAIVKLFLKRPSDTQDLVQQVS